MSDLQCPARLLLASPAEAGHEPDLADAVVGDRVARVWTSPTASAVRTAEAVAARLGVGVLVHEDLQDRSVGGETVAQAGVRVAAVLAEIADAHRGEAVLVVSHARALRAAVPSTADLIDRVVVGLEGDADGWVVLHRG